MKMSAAVRADQVRITVYNCDDPKSVTVTKDHINFNKIVDLISKYKGEQVQIESILKLIERKDIVEKEDHIEYKNVKMSKKLKNHILKCSNDYEINSLVNFAKNVNLIPTSYRDANDIERKNPWAEQTKERMFDFITKHGYPITDDGCFLGLRTVTNDYKDKHTRTINNRVGQTPKMHRYLCNHNPKDTCSHGFHIRNKDYGFGGGRIMVNKVNPKNVVCLPDDYKSDKMRVCEYTVLFEIEKDEVLTGTYFASSKKGVMKKNKEKTKSFDVEKKFKMKKKELSFKETNSAEIEWLYKRLKNRKISKFAVINRLMKMSGSNPFTNLSVNDTVSATLSKIKRDAASKKISL